MLHLVTIPNVNYLNKTNLVLANRKEMKKLVPFFLNLFEFDFAFLGINICDCHQ